MKHSKRILATTVIALAATAATAQNTVDIDFSAKTKPRSTMPLFSVGSDRALIFLRPEHQRDLLTLQKEIGFKYLRCHGLLNEEMKIVTRNADGSLSFDWTNVDKFIDALKAAKLKPFIELGFIPETLASGKQTIFWWRGNVTPPAKMEEWALLVSEFAKHVTKRYGKKEVESWYYEVWNEPNLDGFWTGGKQKYFELYAASARALKAVNPKLRVGGPSTAGLAWVPDLIKYCRENQVPIDFASTHAYAAKQGFLDADGKGGGTVLDTDPDALIGGFKWVRGDTPKGMPLFITEWGPSYSPRDPIHDSYVCAPFILEKTRRSEGFVDGLSYWTFSDQFEEPGPPNRPFHGGFGLMTVDGLKKPAYLAYEILARLYSLELPTNHPNVIATKKGSSVRFTLWDYSPYVQDTPNDPFYHRDLPASDKGSVTIRLTNLPRGKYRVERQGVGYQRNDLYGAFLALGQVNAKGANLPTQVVETLKGKVNGPERLDEIEVRDGTATITVPMRTNDVWYFSLTKI